MQVAKVNQLISEFLDHIQSGKMDLYKWRSLKIFQNNWNMEAPRFGPMYEASFASTLENDLWEGNDYFPKRSMLRCIERDPDLVRKMFSELLDERFDVGGRIDRFMYHLEAIREDVNRTDDQYLKHYHGDYRMISVYLSFAHPEIYCICDYNKWIRFMEIAGALNPPGEYEIDRFFKVMRTLAKLLGRHEEITAEINNMTERDQACWQGESLLLSAEFYEFVTSSY